jgi:hypothetical protein
LLTARNVAQDIGYAQYSGLTIEKMLSKVYCSECGREICDGEIAFIVYIDPEDADKGLIACEEFNKRVYSAS